MFVHSDSSRVLEMSAVSAAVAGAMRVVYTLLCWLLCGACYLCSFDGCSRAK
jgi:hypothetical protein